MGTCPLPKINSTADIFCSTSNTHRLELVILPVRGWPSITVKRSLEFGVKNGGTWIIGQGAVGRICLFTCVSGSTVKPQKHLGLRKEKLHYGEFVGLPNKLSLSHNLLFPQDLRVNILIIKINKKKSLHFCSCLWNIFRNCLHWFTGKRETFVLLCSGTTILRWQMQKKHQKWYSGTNLVCQTCSFQISSNKLAYFQNLLFKWSESNTEQVMKALQGMVILPCI